MTDEDASQRRPLARGKLPPLARVLVGLLTYLGVSGLFGGGAFILAPDGRLLATPPIWLRQIPFSSFLFPGLVLFFVVGLLSLLVAAALMWQPRAVLLQRCTPLTGYYWGWTATGLAGCGIIIFEVVESAYIGLAWPQGLYMAIGAAIVLVALSPSVRAHYRLR